MPDFLKKSCSEEQDSRSCTTVASQNATVTVPVIVKPNVKTGDINTFCCGEPKITPSPYTVICSNQQVKSCSFIITQNICIEIPIEFSAEASAACPRIECGEVENNGCKDYNGKE